MTNPNTTEKLIENQIFKITKADEQISEFLIDCGCVNIKTNE